MLPIYRGAKAHMYAHISAQKGAKTPKQKPSHSSIRHFKSSPFPISFHLPKPLYDDEHQHLCVKLMKFHQEVRVGALVRDASAGGSA